MINAITNLAAKGKRTPCDIAAYNVVKCFDAMWADEAINDMWDTGCRVINWPYYIWKIILTSCGKNSTREVRSNHLEKFHNAGRSVWRNVLYKQHGQTPEDNLQR